MSERMTTPEDVKSCYRLLLGRDPENYDVVLEWVNNRMTQRDLVLEFLRSDEFKQRFGDKVKLV